MTVTERMDPFLSEFDLLTQRALGRPTGPAQWYLPMDIVRREDSISISFDLPGVDPGSVDLTLENNVLTVHAGRGVGYGEGEQVLVRERPSGEITRRVSLGDWADPEHVEAAYTDGVLTVTIPVREQAKPRKIAVQRPESKALNV